MPRGLDHIVHAVRDLDAAAELYRGARLHGRRAQPPSLGHAQSHRAVAGLFHRTADAGRAGQARRRRILRFCSAPINGDFLEAQAKGSRCSFWNRATRCRRSRIPRRRDRGFRRHALRARGQAAGRLGGEGRLLARLRRRQARARHPFRRLPAALPGKFLEPGVSAARQRRTASPVSCWWRTSRRDIAIFMLAFTGARTAATPSDGFAIDLPRGAIEVMTPAAFARRFGVEPRRTPRAARGWRRCVCCPRPMRSLQSRSNRPESRLYASRSRRRRQAAMGAVLVFEPAR